MMRRRDESPRGTERVFALSSLAAAALFALAGCAPAADPEAPSRAGPVTAAPVEAANAAPAGFRPSDGRYGIGQDAAPELIARWDIDVGPDGVGLPPGEATVPEGLKFYAARCAVCHGEDGTGGPNDVLAGRIPGDEFPFATEPVRSTVGNYWPYATTLFDYTRKAMPFDAPGSLSDHDVYASVAAILYLNGLIAEDAIVDAELITNLVMPSRDRFVPDDRAGGPVVR